MSYEGNVHPNEPAVSAEPGHGRLKDKVRDDLQHVVEREIHEETPEERTRIESVAHELKQNTISEIAESERATLRTRRIERMYSFVDFVFYVIYGLVGLMIGLELFGARDWSAFMRFMRTITTPILAPFQGVMPDPAIGSMQLMVSYILALVVYLLLHRTVKGLFQLLANRRKAQL